MGFGVLKAFEWTRELSRGLVPATNNFFMYYYVLTGLHLLHVVIGMGVLGYLMYVSRLSGSGGPAILNQRLVYVESGACFWHMVDLVWIVLFPLLYLIK